MKFTRDQLIGRLQRKLIELELRANQAVSGALAQHGPPVDWPPEVAAAIDRRWQRRDKCVQSLMRLSGEEGR